VQFLAGLPTRARCTGCMQVFQTLRSAFDSPCSHRDVQLQFELSALQTRYGSVQLRSTSPRTSRWIGGPSSKRTREGSIPSWCAHAAFDYWLGREVLNLEERDRYSHAVPMSLPADPAASLRTRHAVVQLHPGTPRPCQRIWRRCSERRTTLFDSARGHQHSGIV
jgi:hypothetical protein